eukprot:13781517-Alexandrium_andersonii.AAC.1
MADIGFSYFKHEDAPPLVAERVHQLRDVGVSHGIKGLNLPAGSRGPRLRLPAFPRHKDGCWGDMRKRRPARRCPGPAPSTPPP